MCQVQTILLICTIFRKHSGLYFWAICVAVTAVATRTIGVVLVNLVLDSDKMWIATVLITGGTLTWAPAQYLFIFSRLQLLQASHSLSRSIMLLLFMEYIGCEVPANSLYLASSHYPLNRTLRSAMNAYVSVAAVSYFVTITGVTGCYMLLAWCEYMTAL